MNKVETYGEQNLRNPDSALLGAPLDKRDEQVHEVLGRGGRGGACDAAEDGVQDGPAVRADDGLALLGERFDGDRPANEAHDERAGGYEGIPLLKRERADGALDQGVQGGWWESEEEGREVLYDLEMHARECT